MESHPKEAAIPAQIKVLLLICIALPIARFILFPEASGGSLFWAALFGALSLSIWIGKSSAAKALGYILLFMGVVAPAMLLLKAQSWPSATFLLIQAAIHLVTARQLLKSPQLQAFLTSMANPSSQAS
jgi:hypothetical protein